MNLIEGLEKIGQEFNCTSDLAYDRAYFDKRAQPRDRALLLVQGTMTRAHILRLMADTPQGIADYRDTLTYYRKLCQEDWTAFWVEFHGFSAAFEHAHICRMLPPAAIAKIDEHLALLPTLPEVERSSESNLVIYCPEYYEQVVEEARSRGLLEKFESVIRDRCIDYAQHRVFYRCALTKDFAPMSFGWQPQTKESEGDEWRPMMTGGLIFHESSQDWSVHT